MINVTFAIRFLVQNFPEQACIIFFLCVSDLFNYLFSERWRQERQLVYSLDFCCCFHYHRLQKPTEASMYEACEKNLGTVWECNSAHRSS